MRPATAILSLSMLAALPQNAIAWGDEGHQIVALIAEHYLTPAAKRQVDVLLAADTDSLTAHNIADAATWADKYRASHRETASWHFADIEISAPDLKSACFGRQPLPAGTLASNGPAMDCVVDKVEQFATEIADPKTDLEERVVALKFLLHFVGDLHQPLHSADDNDRGGNNKKVSADTFRAGNLHHYWDSEFVARLETDAKAVATELIGHITSEQAQSWRKGSATDWATEAFYVAKADAYGKLPAPSSRGSYRLSDDYVNTATDEVAMQLSRAGVRLAEVLNRALGK
jgi:hypothetical protein